MTMLANTPSTTAYALASGKGFAIFLARIRRLINRWVAAMIAHRERQAARLALRSLDDRELKDIGLYRGEIDDVLAKCAQMRGRMQRFR